MAVPVVTHFPAPSSRWKAVKTNGKASDSLKHTPIHHDQSTGGSAKH